MMSPSAILIAQSSPEKQEKQDDERYRDPGKNMMMRVIETSTFFLWMTEAKVSQPITYGIQAYQETKTTLMQAATQSPPWLIFKTQ